MKIASFINKAVFSSIFVLLVMGLFIGTLFYLSGLITAPMTTAHSFPGFLSLFIFMVILPLTAVSIAARLVFLAPVVSLTSRSSLAPDASSAPAAGLRRARTRLLQLPTFTILLHAAAFAAALPLFAAFSGRLPGTSVLKLFSCLIMGLAAGCLFSFIQTNIDFRILTPIYRSFEGYPPDRKEKRVGLGFRFSLNFLFAAILTFVLLFAVNIAFDLEHVARFRAALLDSVARNRMTAVEAARLSLEGPVASIAVEPGRDDPGFIAVAFSLLGLLGLGCVLPVTAGLRRRVLSQRSLMENILCGNDFFKHRISVIERDEIGMTSLTINRFIDKFKEILEAILSSTDSVQRVSGTLDSSLVNASAAIEEMVHTIKQISSNTGTQKELVNNIRSKIEEMLIGIDGTSFDVVELSNFVQETSSAMHETTANIQTISKNTEQVNDLSNRLVAISQTGSVSVNETVTAIKEIEKAYAQVANIVNVISDIAVQTNLLSLNASIEAAHAGDKGKGFAVVAAEIRKLAEQSHENIALIEKQIENMAEKVKHGVILTTAADSAFHQIYDDIKLTGQHINQVTIALQEQNLGSRDIMTALEEMVKKTVEVKEISEDLKRRSEEIHSHMEELYNISVSITESTDEQDKGNKEILSLISMLVSTSRNNLLVVDSLHSVVNEYDTREELKAADTLPTAAAG